MSRPQPGRIAHTARGVGYRVGNSIRGVRNWVRRGFRRGDHDLQISKADPKCPHAGHREHVDGQCRGHLLVTHWKRPMVRDAFRDPLRKLRTNTPTDQMTLDEARRLRSPDGYAIRTPQDILNLRPIRRGRYIPVWEPKDDVRFEQTWPWEYLAGIHEAAGVPLEVRSLRDEPTQGAGTRRIQAARRGAHLVGADITAWEIR